MKRRNDGRKGCAEMKERAYKTAGERKDSRWATSDNIAFDMAFRRIALLLAVGIAKIAITTTIWMR